MNQKDLALKDIEKATLITAVLTSTMVFKGRISDKIRMYIKYHGEKDLEKENTCLRAKTTLLSTSR